MLKKAIVFLLIVELICSQNSNTRVANCVRDIRGGLDDLIDASKDLKNRQPKALLSLAIDLITRRLPEAVSDCPGLTTKEIEDYAEANLKGADKQCLVDAIIFYQDAFTLTQDITKTVNPAKLIKDALKFANDGVNVDQVCSALTLE